MFIEPYRENKIAPSLWRKESIDPNKGDIMKYFKSIIALLFISLLFSFPAFAGNGNGGMQDMRGNIQDSMNNMQNRMQDRRDNFHSRMQDMRGNMQDSMNNMQNRMQDRRDNMRDRLNNMGNRGGGHNGGGMHR
jgi:ElaB/YqjD/DUF883 family membrane-anchored ribosome-binding protein